MKMLPRRKLNRIFGNLNFYLMAYGTRFEVGFFISYNCWNNIHFDFNTGDPRLQLFQAIVNDGRRRM